MLNFNGVKNNYPIFLTRNEFRAIKFMEPAALLAFRNYLYETY
jgi:hypothetical protein